MTKTATANKPLQWESEMWPGTGVCQVGRDLGTEGKAARREKATVTGPSGALLVPGRHRTVSSHPRTVPRASSVHSAPGNGPRVHLSKATQLGGGQDPKGSGCKPRLLRHRTPSLNKQSDDEI